MKNYTIPLLPLPQEVETKVVLKQLAKSERALGELKGMVQKVPNQAVLINTIFAFKQGYKRVTSHY